MQYQPLHSALEPLAWLEGTWRAEDPGDGNYPTINTFTFLEELSFVSIGQPMFNYVGQSWDPESKMPLHREVGFLKILPGINKVALVLAHDFGLATIEEGCINDGEMTFESTSIARMTTGCKDPKVLQIDRKFRLIGSRLQQIINMDTTSVSEITEHTRIIYRKIHN